MTEYFMGFLNGVGVCLSLLAIAISFKIIQVVV